MTQILNFLGLLPKVFSYAEKLAGFVARMHDRYKRSQRYQREAKRRKKTIEAIEKGDDKKLNKQISDMLHNIRRNTE